MSESSASPLSRLLRSPLLHFLILGVVFFALYTRYGQRSETESKEIVVSAQQVEMLAALWEKQWRRPPLPNELQGLIDSFVREEVLYREALAMGLDRDDTVVRRRLAQKIEMLAKDLATQVEPSDQELRAFFDEHPEIFEQPGLITFTHVYINLDQHEDRSFVVADEILEKLRAGGDPSALGDRFMLQRDYLRKSPSEVARHFGTQFAEEVFELPVGDWQGPVQSGYGLHLVRVEGQEEPYMPPLEDIRPTVRDEFLSYRRREVDELFYNKLRERYEIVIEEPSPATDAETATS